MVALKFMRLKVTLPHPAAHGVYVSVGLVEHGRRRSADALVQWIRPMNIGLLPVQIPYLAVD